MPKAESLLLFLLYLMWNPLVHGCFDPFCSPIDFVNQWLVDLGLTDRISTVCAHRMRTFAGCVHFFFFRARELCSKNQIFHCVLQRTSTKSKSAKLNFLSDFFLCVCVLLLRMLFYNLNNKLIQKLSWIVLLFCFYEFSCIKFSIVRSLNTLCLFYEMFSFLVKNNE